MAWRAFARKLKTALAALEEGQYLVLSVKNSDRYVQFAGRGADGMRAETTSNVYLDPSEQIDEADEHALTEAGWLAPTCSSNKAGSPNFFVDYPSPVPYEDVTALAVHTLSEILRVVGPDSLEYDASERQHTLLAMSQLGLTRRCSPDEAVRQSTMLDYSIPLSETANVVQQLRTKGRNSAFAILMFRPPETLPGPADAINLQYSIENGTVGLDWVLLGPRNIADKDRLAEFICSRGFTVEETELNNTRYLRVEHGDITDLGVSIARDFYRRDDNYVVGLLVDGFDYQPNQDCSKGFKFVGDAGRQIGHAGEVKRIAAMLRLIAGKTTGNRGDGTVANASFRTNDKYVWLTDEITEEGEHEFRSEVSSSTEIREIEKRISEQHGVDLMPACGYGRSYYDDGDYVRLFSIPTVSAEFHELAEFIMGLLDLLFAHRQGDPVDIDFFVPGPDFSKLSDYEDLPEFMQGDYCEFKARYHDAMAHYHSLMAREDNDPFDPKAGVPADVCKEMQSVSDDFPSFLATLADLDDSYAIFLKVAEDNQVEMTESLNMLRCRYRAQLFN